MASLRTRLNIARRLIGGDDVIEKQLFGAGRPEEEYAVAELYGGSNSSKNQKNLHSMVGTVYDCANLLAERSSQYEIELYKVGDGGAKERIDSHELIDLMRRPQPSIIGGVPGSELFYMTRNFRDLAGEAFWLIEKGSQTGKIKNIKLLDPTRVGIIPDKSTGESKYYTYRKSQSSNMRFELDEVWQFRRPNAVDPYHGLSIISSHAVELAIDKFSGTFTRNFFKNNAGISGVLNIKGMVNKDVFKRFAQLWRQKYEGVDNAGKVAIMRDTDSTFTKVGIGLNELDMAALKKMTKEDILQAFRVPKPLLGQADSVGLGQEGISALEYVFAKYVIDPEFDAYDSVIQQIADVYYPDEKLIVSHKSVIPEDKAFRQQQENEFVNRVLTINEVRENHGLEAVDGGDELYIPINQVGVGESTEPEVVQAKTIKVNRKTLKKEVVNSENANEFIDKSDKLQEKYEKKFKKALAPIIERQQKEVLQNIEALGKDYEQLHFDEQQADREFTEALVPVVVSLLTVQGALSLLFAGEDKDFIVSAGLEAQASASISRMARDFNDETLSALNKTIAEGIAEGESVAKLKKRIEAEYKELKGYRAERIARTETIKAANNATVEAYKQAGYITGKKWSAEPGACGICLSLDGQVVSLDDSFVSLGDEVNYEEDGQNKTYKVEYESITNGEAHPNCRCRMLPFRGEV